jgi:hypothetical protein
MVYRPGFLEVLTYLAGVSYPSRRRELVEAARVNGASEEVLRLIRGLHDQVFDDDAEVSNALANADGYEH